LLSSTNGLCIVVLCKVPSYPGGSRLAAVKLPSAMLSNGFDYQRHWFNPVSLFNRWSQSLELGGHSKVPMYSPLT